MDNVFLQEFITQVEHELEDNRRKKLEGEGMIPQANSDCENSDLDPNKITVRGDEFERAQQLDRKAEKCESDGKQVEAQEIRDRSRAHIETQLNELDGFDRQTHPL